MAKLLGIMGGTFNPIHNGHLRIAEIARQALGLDEVRFIPTGDPPHKAVNVSSAHRMDMVKLAIAGRAGFTASDMEIKRAGRSYTCETLRLIHLAEPQSELYFILGGDMLTSIMTWRNPIQIFETATLAAVPRPGDDEIRMRNMIEYLRGEYKARIRLLSEMGPDISSTNIRALVRAGEDIDALVPAEVAAYIRENKLYLQLETLNDA